MIVLIHLNVSLRKIQMEQIGDKDQDEKKVYKVTTVPFALRDIKENITVNT